MIQPLRKIHRRFFFLLAFVLPLFFVAGILGRHRVLRSSMPPKDGRFPSRSAQNPQLSQNLPAGAVR